MKKVYPERQEAPGEAVALDPDHGEPEPDTALLVDAAVEAGVPGIDLDHDLGMGQGVAVPHSVPGPLSPHRWPGLRDAVGACLAAVHQFPPIPDASERYLYLHDLGQIPKTGWSDVEAQALRRIWEAEKFMCGWGSWARTPDQLGTERTLRLGPDGTIRWEALSIRAEDVETWKAIRTGGPQPYDTRTQRLVLSMDSLHTAVESHRAEMGIILDRLGLGQNENPTVQGRTWLCQWPVVEGVGADGTRMTNEAALVVAGPGAILMQGATLLLCTARDLGSPDADIYPTQLASFSLRLNETQRLAWGPSMQRLGRVYWAIQDEVEAKPKRVKKQKKEKPAPPES